MITIPFDQYQRYNNAAQIINNTRTNSNETFRILEVGANEHQNLERFLPNDDIQYLDIHLSPELLNNPKYILGDATKMSFDNGAFDIIVALDVFEHIPPERRTIFIDELYRVSSMGVLLTAPFLATEVVAAENRLNVIFKSLLKQDYIWLEEHRQNGLPRLIELEQYFQRQGYAYKILSHGNIHLWERIMTIHFIAVTNPKLLEYRQEIDTFYNQYLFHNDYSEDSYRKIVLISKNRNLDYKVNSSSPLPTDDLQKLAHLELTFFHLAELLKEENIKEIEKEETIPRQDRIQVFLDFGNGFNEDESHISVLNVNDLISHFSLSINETRPVKALRIDPSDYAGAFKIDNLGIVSSGNKHTGNVFIQEGNYSLVVEGIHIFEQDDPNLILEVDVPSVLQRIEFDVLYISRDYRLLIYHLNTSIKSLLDNVSVLKGKNEELQFELEVSKGEIEKYQLEQERLIDTLRSSEKENETYRELIEENKRKNEDYQTEVEQKINKLNEHTEKLNIELNNILNSKSWRLIRFLRKITRG